VSNLILRVKAALAGTAVGASVLAATPSEDGPVVDAFNASYAKNWSR
jgi:hypothetical protein